LSDVHLLAREFHSLVCGCHDSRASQYHHFAGLCLVLHRRRRCCFCFFFFIAFLLLFCIFFVLLLLYCVGFKFSLPALVLFYFTVETFFLDPFQPPSIDVCSVTVLVARASSKAFCFSLYGRFCSLN